MKNEFAQTSASQDFLSALHRRRTEASGPSDYPRCKYGQNGEVRIVQTAEAEADLGDNWYDSPADVPEATAPDPAPSQAVDCASCAALTAELDSRTEYFKTALADTTTQNGDLLKENADLRQHKQSVQEHLDVAAGKLKAAVERIAVLEQEAAAQAPVVAEAATAPEKPAEKPAKKK